MESFNNTALEDLGSSNSKVLRDDNGEVGGSVCRTGLKSLGKGIEYREWSFKGVREQRLCACVCVMLFGYFICSGYLLVCWDKKALN